MRDHCSSLSQNKFLRTIPVPLLKFESETYCQRAELMSLTLDSRYRAIEENLRVTKTGHLANWMHSLASTGNLRAAELIDKADELDKMINADLWDTEQVLGTWLWARKLWCDAPTSAPGLIVGSAR
jgi:hypothetical protein